MEIITLGSRYPFVIYARSNMNFGAHRGILISEQKAAIP